MNRPMARVYAAALLAATLTSCSSSNPSAPTPTLTTETFIGTLSPGQKVVQPFTVKAAGTVTTTLAGLAGADYIGIGNGTWDGTICTVGVHAETVVVGNYFLTDVPGAQSLCILVYDVGRVTTTATYTVTVSHP